MYNFISAIGDYLITINKMSNYCDISIILDKSLTTINMSKI